MDNKFFVGKRVSSLETYSPVGPITGVALVVDENNEYRAGTDDGYVIEIECPYGTQTMADALLESLSGQTYRGYRADAAELAPEAELGDGITVGGVYSMLAYRSVGFGPGHMSEIAAPGENELEHEYPYQSQAEKQIDRKIATTRSMITKTAEEIRLEVSNELDGLSSSIDLKLDSITSTVQGLNGKISTLEQTDSEIRAEITDQINGLSSSIDIKLDGITSTVQGLDSNVSSIEQKVDSINIGVTTKDGVSTIELTGTGITASSATIDLSGFVTLTGLSGGTTTIDGSCIKTGTIDADRINLTGAIAWGDLSSSVQNKINNAGDTVPSYIKSTYIDFSSVSSPKIVGNEIITTGHFAVTGDVGGVAGDLGYMGGANGLDAAGNITYGVALSNGSPDGLGDGDNYLIVTNGGVRMQAGTHRLTVTSNGCYADGSLIGSGAATWG